MKKQIASSVTALLLGSATASAEQQATFDSDLEGWGATPGATIDWVEEDSNGYAEASFTNDAPWYFEAPAAWLGDWSGYRQLKWDLVIASGGYAVSNANDIVVIEGANGTNLVWHGPSPYWEWTHYEFPLEPEYFGVDQTTFDGVITNVSGFKVLGEYRGGNETIGLDNVLATTNAPVVHTALESTFDTDMEGWRPYDDVTLTWVPTNGNPGGYLHGLDWADGRSYRFKTPVSWAGDWSAFKLLSFDLVKIPTAASSTEREVVWIRGGSGETLAYVDSGPGADWTNYEIYLVPENFDVDQATFDRVMGHVTEMLILGEYFNGDEQEGLDNVVLSSEAVVPFFTDFTSSFDSDLEGWTTDGDGDSEWVATGGNPGGYLLGKDQALGSSWHFVSPAEWQGNWINFTWLQFKLKAMAGGWSFNERPMVCLSGMNGIDLWWTGPVPHQSWTPYGIALTPEAFGTNAVVFNSVMSYVKELRIYGEVSSGVDRAAMDSFGLHIDRPATMWPDRSSTFDADMEEWRKLESITLNWEATGGNPDGFLRGSDDGSGAWHFVSPEVWNGDWTEYRSLKFDHIILRGSYADWGTPTFYIVGANNQRLSWIGPATSNTWVRFEVPLSPVAFGVDQAAYDAVMERVVELRIRGEYVAGPDEEGLDNVFLSVAAVGGPASPILAVGYDGTNVVVQFQTETNVTYQLQASTNLVEGVGWEDVPGESLLGDGGLGELESDIALPLRFLRLHAE